MSALTCLRGRPTGHPYAILRKSWLRFTPFKTRTPARVRTYAHDVSLCRRCQRGSLLQSALMKKIYVFSRAALSFDPLRKTKTSHCVLLFEVPESTAVTRTQRVLSGAGNTVFLLLGSRRSCAKRPTTGSGPPTDPGNKSLIPAHICGPCHLRSSSQTIHTTYLARGAGGERPSRTFPLLDSL